MKKTFHKVKNYLLESELRISIFALLVVFLVIVLISLQYYGDPEFLEGILVEAHGMILDLVIIGVFILWLNLLRDKKERLRRYQEEIDDYREWTSDEASHRIAGNIKRLNKGGITNLFLSLCYMRKADLRNANLAHSSMHQVDLGESKLRETNLSHANLDTAFLGKSDLRNAVLDNANLTRARLHYAKAHGASFKNTNLSKADMSGGSFRSADFKGADFQKTKLVGADFSGADLRDTKNLAAESLLEASHLGYALLDKNIEDVIREQKPNLLKGYHPKKQAEPAH